MVIRLADTKQVPLYTALPSHDTAMIIGRFMNLWCLILSPKNQTGQTGKLETGRKDLFYYTGSLFYLTNIVCHFGSPTKALVGGHFVEYLV
jgi:hypothetical protein